MIVCNTKKALANSTNSNDVAGAVAVKEYIESNGDNLKPSSTVTVSTGVTKTLQTYVEDIAEDQAQIYTDGVLDIETVTLESEYTTIYLKKTGNVVQLNIDAISGATFTAWAETILATIPEGYRPAAIVYCYDTMTGSNVRSNGVLKLYTNGTIGLTYSTAQTALQALSITYII